MGKEYGEKRKNELISDFDMNRSLINFLCGDYIGEGIDRTVFEYAPDKKYVVKIEEKFPRSNLLEWEIWKNIKEAKDYSKWFAECHYISDCGKILIQRKTEPISDKEWGSLKVPTYFTDRKQSNFGKIGKQVVAHDYALCLVRFMYFGMPNRNINVNRDY